MVALLKRPSAFVPVAMSSIVMALILSHVARFGVVHDADEGTGAHLFQILMPAQVPIIAFFAIKWLQRNRTPAMGVLALQVGAWIAVIAVVMLLGL